MTEGDEPIAGRKVQVVEEIETVKGAKTKTKSEEEEEETKKPRPRKNDDRSFVRYLMDFFVGAPQGGAIGTTPTRMSDATLEERLIARTAQGRTAFDAELFTALSEELVKGLRKGFVGRSNADVAVQYGLTSDAMRVAMEINLFQFSAAKTLAEVQELNRLFRESRSFREFERRAREVCDTFNRKWQQTEYTTAVLTAEGANSYRQLMQQTRFFPYWEYVTAGDDHVREEHRLLDGVILQFDDPRWRKIFPPNGWNCRCTVISRTRNQAKGVDLKAMQERVDRFLQTREWRKAEAQGWGVNRALVGEVFTQNQFYIRRFQDKASKLLGKLYYSDWGLDSFGKRLAAATEAMPEWEGTAEAWYAEHEILEDYLGRRVTIDPAVFATHTMGSHAMRVALLEALPDVLKNPDEVWLNDYMDQFKNLNFIRFYNGKVINVICEVTEQLEYRVTTWFEIPTNPKINRSALKRAQKSPRVKDPRWRYRRGLLIKK